MGNKKRIGDDLEKQIIEFENFKIGKTGQTLDERYRQEYESDYEGKQELFSSSSKEEVDNMEEYLIERFIHEEKCDNEQVGGGDMTNSSRYLVYLVFNWI